MYIIHICKIIISEDYKVIGNKIQPWRISMVLSNISFFSTQKERRYHIISKIDSKNLIRKKWNQQTQANIIQLLILIPRIVKKLTLYFANFQFLINHRNQCSIIVAGNIESIIDIFRKLFQQTLFVGSYSNLIEILRPFICKKC